MQIYDLTFEAAEAIAILEQDAAENETENVCEDLEDISFPDLPDRQQ